MYSKYLCSHEFLCNRDVLSIPQSWLLSVCVWCSVNPTVSKAPSAWKAAPAAPREPSKFQKTLSTITDVTKHMESLAEQSGMSYDQLHALLRKDLGAAGKDTTATSSKLCNEHISEPLAVALQKQYDTEDDVERKRRLEQCHADAILAKRLSLQSASTLKAMVPLDKETQDTQIAANMSLEWCSDERVF